MEALDPAAIKCRVLVGGELGERRASMSRGNLSVPTLTDKDISDIRWGVEHKVDYIAVSFVRTKEDILGVRKVEEHLGESKIIAKIETRRSVKILMKYLLL